MKNFGLKFRRLILSLLLLFWISVSFAGYSYAQEPIRSDSVLVLYPQHNGYKWHPDGELGKFSLHGTLEYASVTKATGEPVVDIQNFAFGGEIIPVKQLALLGRYQFVYEDSLLSQFAGGIRYYSKNPMDSLHPINPDGAVGWPVVEVWLGSRFGKWDKERSKIIGDVKLTLPVNADFSVSAAYRHYAEIDSFDVDQFAFGVTFYQAKYTPGRFYENPDGPLGHPVYDFLGGGSKNGIFGQFRLVIPINTYLTFRTIIRGERAADPYRRMAIGGVSISFYPGK